MGKDSASKNIHFRGVERYTTDEANFVMERRNRAYDVVYAYQELEPELMVAYLMAVSCDSHKEARKRGLSDEKEARDVFGKKTSKTKASSLLQQMSQKRLIPRIQDRRASRAA